MAIVMHRSTSGRTSLAFWIVVMMRPLTLGLLVVGLGVALGEDQRRGQAAQQGPLVAADCGRACGLFVDVAWSCF